MTNFEFVHDWYAGLELLSLDYAHPVFSQLGLSACRNGEEILRRESRVALGAPIAMSDEDVNTFYECKVLAFLSVLEKELGPCCERRVQTWITSTACTDAHNPWVHVEDSFCTWASDWSRSGIDRIEFVEPQLILSALKDHQDLDAEENTLRSQRDHPLSEWDRVSFVQRGLLELPGNGDYYPWEDAVWLVIRMAKFQQFWKWLVTVLRPTEVANVERYLRERLSREQIIRIMSLTL